MLEWWAGIHVIDVLVSSDHIFLLASGGPTERQAHEGIPSNNLHMYRLTPLADLPEAQPTHSISIIASTSSFDGETPLPTAMATKEAALPSTSRADEAASLAQTSYPQAITPHESPSSQKNRKRRARVASIGPPR